VSNDNSMKAFTPEDQDQSDKPAQHQGENPKVLYIPVEPTGEAMKHAIKTDPGKAVHNIALNDLDSVFNALFVACGADQQLIHALDAAYLYMIDEMQYEHATVCGIGVGVAIHVIGSFLAHAPDTTSKALSPNAAQLRAEITAKFPDAVQRLFGLEIERKGSAGNGGATAAQRHDPEAHETRITGNEEGN
jgi:hypothetical protein